MWPHWLRGVACRVGGRRRRLSSSWTAALLVLFGCGEPSSKQTTQKPETPIGTGLTIELPEPVAELATSAPLAEKAELAEAKPAPVDEPSPTAAASEKKGPEDTRKKVPAAPEPQPPAPGEAPPTAAEVDPAPRPSASSSRPPLPDTVIARTLDRIGFRCGSVTSTGRIEGSDDPSAYRVTCSSGQSYRASARSGRYRFTELKSE
jgi:hypothetical protein